MRSRGEKRSRRSWSAAEKQVLLQRARERVASGESWEAAAGSLGVWPSSLKRWHEQFPEGGFRAVVMRAAEPVPAPAPRAGVVITTPDGFRIEGLDTDGAFLLLEGMRCSV
jgi:transposase-like protein